MTYETNHVDPVIEALEIDLLLEAILQIRGWDFRQYAKASLNRRVRGAVESEKLRTVSSLLDLVVHDRDAMDRLLRTLSVNVSAMFRDHDFYRAFRENVIPVLKTLPMVRIWSAACSTGEEPYSLAILLEEEGIYDRCRIYATDMNDSVVRRAREGIFPQDLMDEYRVNYLASGGREDFARYYVAGYDHVVMNSSLRRNIVFARHNLVSDSSFNEFHVIFCRNVMIYFQIELQMHVTQLLCDSLDPTGFLGLGDKETLRFMPQEKLFRQINPKEKIYQKTA